jgi:hypothetical protein
MLKRLRADAVLPRPDDIVTRSTWPNPGHSRCHRRCTHSSDYYSLQGHIASTKFHKWRTQAGRRLFYSCSLHRQHMQHTPCSVRLRMCSFLNTTGILAVLVHSGGLLAVGTTIRIDSGDCVARTACAWHVGQHAGLADPPSCSYTCTRTLNAQPMLAQPPSDDQRTCFVATLCGCPRCHGGWRHAHA